MGPAEPAGAWKLGRLAVALLALAIGFGAGVSAVRCRVQLVALEDAADERWQQIETELFRQYELMPRLVKVTRRHTGGDAPALDALFSARARYARAQGRDRPALARDFEGAMAEVLALATANRQLGADPAFLDLSAEIASARSRIANDGNRYDAAVVDLNGRLRNAPWRWLAAGVEPRRPYGPGES